MRRISGDVMDLMPVESRFHDLFAFSFAAGRKRSVGEFCVSDAVQLLIEGTTPTLALREGAGTPTRALVVLDGSPASTRTVGAFLDQNLFELSAIRFLAIARDAGEAQSILREQSDVLRGKYPDCEWGYIAGSSKRLAAQYAERWQADLVVIGARRSPPVVRYFFGETVREILRRTNCSIYAWS
jgi:nucleotide-binding universal stress UspA family protein